MVQALKDFLGIVGGQYDLFVVLSCLVLIIVSFYFILQVFLYIFKWVGGIR